MSIRAIVVTGKSLYEQVQEVQIESYKDYYKHICCDSFDIVRTEWDGEDISIYLDDEGLLKPQNYGRLVEGYPQPLFGNLVITGGVDAEGDTLPLPDKFNVINILKHIGEIEYVTRG